MHNAVSDELNLRGHVKLATGEGYAPFVDVKLPEGGWSVSLVKHTFDYLNLDVSVDILPWSRALKWAKESKVLAAFPFVYSNERAKSFLFSEPINYVPVHMYVAEHSSFTQAEQLKKMRLCFPLGYSLDSVEQAIVDKFSMTINRVKDGLGCIKHVSKGWSDAGLTNGYIDAGKIKKQGASQATAIRIFPEQLALVPLYLVISKEHAEGQRWLDEFNHGLSLLKNNGEKSRIDNQYLELLNK